VFNNALESTKKIGRIMSMGSFPKRILETHKEKVIELQKNTRTNNFKEEPQFYLISVVSNE